MFPVHDPIVYFGILAAGILLAPVLSSRFRIPDLIILLVYGAIIGPNGLHVLDRNIAVTMLGSVGMIYIMFLAGLEIDFYKFRKSYKRSIVLGILTFLIPQILGTYAGKYILGMNWTSSVLLASMFASHTLLAYPQASKLGIAQREPVAITVGATIITDTLALLVLAVIADSAKGISLDGKLIFTIFGGMIILTVLIWKVVPLITRWFFSKISEESNTQFLFVIMILCLFAYLSHMAKMEPIIGAFLVGAAFNSLIPEQGRLMNRIHFTGNTLFIPIFLISVGMLVDIRSMMSDTRSWIVGGVMVAAVIISKFLAAQIARFLYKYSSASGNVIFGLSVVQAAATLAAVIVGYELKILPEEVLNGTILMILATCLLGSWIVEYFGRKLALENKQEHPRAVSSQRLLVMISSLKTGLPLLDLSFLLNEKKSNTIYPYTIVKKQSNIDNAIAEGEKLLGHCVAHAVSADVIVSPSLRIEDNVSDGINHAALELNTNTVIMGYSGNSKSFGVIRTELVENCRSRLLFNYFRKPLNTMKRIIIPAAPFAARRHDFGEFIKTSKLLASRTGTELLIYAASSDVQELTGLFNDREPDCKLKIVGYDKWQNMLRDIAEKVEQYDMLLLPLDRRSGVMWTPSLEHLPQTIRNKYPDNNLILDYPSMINAKPVNFEIELQNESDAPKFAAVEADKETDLKEIIALLANETIPENTTCLDETCQHLNDLINSSPLELIPSVVLIHTQNTSIKDTLIAVCHSAKNIEIKDTEPAKFIIALLSSKELQPELHLQSLSFIATGIRKISQHTGIDKVNSAEKLCELLKNQEKI